MYVKTTRRNETSSRQMK